MQSNNKTATPLKRLNRMRMGQPKDLPITDKKVLVVEDNPMLVKLYTAYLKGDYYIDTAYNGNDALIKIQRTPPHLIILDIMMPDLDGFAVAQTMKDLDISIPTIVLTAKHLDQGEASLLQSLGINHYYQKDDITKDVLLTHVSSLIGESR